VVGSGPGGGKLAIETHAEHRARWYAWLLNKITGMEDSSQKQQLVCEQCSACTSE